MKHWHFIFRECHCVGHISVSDNVWHSYDKYFTLIFKILIKRYINICHIVLCNFKNLARPCDRLCIMSYICVCVSECLCFIEQQMIIWARRVTYIFRRNRCETIEGNNLWAKDIKSLWYLYYQHIRTLLLCTKPLIKKENK